MPGRFLLGVGAALIAIAGPAYAQNLPAAPDQPRPILREVRVVGASELSDEGLLASARLRLNEPLPDAPENVAAAVEREYRDAGYSFAAVTAVFDEANGSLTLTIDEGRIDEVEFTGVPDNLARSLSEDFALRAGDIFNRTRALEALRALLRPSRGALRAGSDDFDLITRNGRRVLVVGIDERAGMFRTTVDMGDREDWFTPVDGLVPSLGFGAAVFDHRQFNHAYITGHLAYKMATGRGGYALGFERPLFRPVTFYFGGELFDLTATDDVWRVSGTQASLSAFAARTSFRDYYRRKGVQLNVAARVSRQIEALFAWRGERHETLAVESDFSLWNGDDEFRPNLGASAGKLNALIFGASLDSVGFDRDSLAATYRRHQLETPFGGSLRNPSRHPGEPLVRVDWTSEISSPSRFGGDFSFRRHIVSGRVAYQPSAHEEVRARAIGGWSQGVLPPQRQFAIGGLGSVHGYGFKEAVGDRLLLLNFEYALGKLNGLHIAPFFDAGRVATRAPHSSTWLKGVGFGIGAGRDLRVDFGYKVDDIPGSFQVLLRIGRTF
jgi:hypothetical protein